MADLLQVPAGTPGKGLTRQETRIIYVTEAKKENVMDFLNIPSASEVLYFGQEKVALYSTKPRRLRSLPSVLFPITISPLPTLSSSLPPISVLDTRIAPSLLLPTPSRMPSLPSLLSPIPPSTLSKLTPLQSTLEPISASCARLPPLDLTAVAVAATFKNRVAPLPPIRSQAAQQKVDTERVVEHRIILVKEASKENVLSYSDFVSASAPECQEKAKENMDGDATETSSMLASVQEEAEEGDKRKNKRKSLKTRFQNFFRRLNCFCSRTEE
ncbi:uncharacterized protein LOC134462329 [Engraulis encrasicolus]|uniref:uncharacterized protein LOC134462329 n=1 Tax=Engraulis encrasicolus TaxID=184585 RepID=UPI002FD41536